MPAKASLLLKFSASDAECGGALLNVPEVSVDPGEPVPIYLWAATESELDGYTLAQGAAGLGPGELRWYPGQTEVKYFDMGGTNFVKRFDWPVSGIMSVRAHGSLFSEAGGVITPLAGPGEDVSRYFARQGGRCLAVVPGTPKLYGTVRAEATRPPCCRVWNWIAPDEPSRDFTADGCPPTSQRDDDGTATAWFFLFRYGVLREEFALTIEPYVPETPGEDADYCAATAELIAFVTAASRQCSGWYRACRLHALGDGAEISYVPDDSGADNDLAAGAGTGSNGQHASTKWPVMLHGVTPQQDLISLTGGL